MDDGENLDSVQLAQTENADSSQDWREHGGWSERKTRGLITGVIIELVEIAFSAMSITNLSEVVHTNTMQSLRWSSPAPTW